jgi:SAM-dependent methyltransferase
MARYDTAGRTYARTRRPDPRIGRLVDEALADAVTVVNVGAGTGSYEPRDRRVVAIEPSVTMIRQRPHDAAPAVLGDAERLPLADASVDAALAVLTVHHWRDQAGGLEELRRVARDRVVVLTWDTAFAGRFWLGEYLPGLVTVHGPRFPPLEVFAAALGPLDVVPVPVPHDCVDGFLAAFWRRPEAYLDPAVRANMSPFDVLSAEEIEAGTARLADDLHSGEWHRRHAHLLALDELDAGYRLLVARPA